ncbi:YaeQ family protein [Pseudoxanthomonas sp. JBR18]|uniref:YaeQ family protein n=1 Tax=Pseudoxanthomonas sp. JBR18 TaxID=2969308 RepID=UPI002305634C|nr:YaeQ family protein [Pseudoxanthomonas sp. JBR18]WCE04120.1 YaeQ family protein [Pseudoxanthomonas sp. JBR18]
MALSATIRKVELQINDLDRHHYASHSLTLAQHPSETDERLVARLLAFVLYAHERLEFGRGLSAEDEPDLWRRDYTGQIEQWIDLGQPDENRLRKAAGRASEVVVVNYGGHAAEVWWHKQGAALRRMKQLTVIDLPHDVVSTLASHVQRTMRLDVLIQDGEVQIMGDALQLVLVPGVRHAPQA